MNKIIWLLVSCISLSVCGQTKVDMNDIGNSKTKEHINIPGTRLYIIPPADFKIATSFIGLQKGDSSTLQITDLVGENYHKKVNMFSKEHIEQMGAKIIDYRELKVNGFAAKYILMQDRPNIKNICLVFGDTTFATMIMATYPSADDITGEQIQNTIKTICYDKDTEIDPLAVAPFTLDTSKSIFKFSKSASTREIFIYSIGGLYKESFKDETFISVSPISKNVGSNAKDISEMLVECLEKSGFTGKKLKNISTTDVNGQEAYEVEVHGKMEGKKSLFYLLVIVTRFDKAIVIQGTVKSDLDNNLREIKNLVKTIELK